MVAWTVTEYIRHDQLLPTSVFSSRIQLQGLHMELSETVVDNACPLRCADLFFTDRVSQTSAPAPTRRSSFMEVVREQNVVHHVLSQSMSMELKTTMLFDAYCCVISASAGDSIDSTCSATFVRCVVQASSSLMFALASPTGLTLSRIPRGEPELDLTSQRSTTFCWRKFQHGSDHRSVALPFHFFARSAYPKKTSQAVRHELGPR